MSVKSRLEILEERQSMPLNERHVAALEAMSDTLNDIFFKLRNMDSKL